LDTGKVAAAFFIRHTFEIYTDADHRYLDLPPGLRHWINRVTDENSPPLIPPQPSQREESSRVFD